MFDRNFFEKNLSDQVGQMAERGDEGYPSVEVHLLDGYYNVRRIADVFEGVVVLEVHPQGPEPPAKEAPKAGAPQEQFDRVAVAYHAIVKVVMTLKSPSKGIAGFAKR